MNAEMQKGDVIIWQAQTLHGGNSVMDNLLTRKSYVMHLTPENTPVGHMQYFFHPEKQQLHTASWGYQEENGRKFAAHKQVGFAHKLFLNLDEFDQTTKQIVI